MSDLLEINLQGLHLSASELAQLTEWNPLVIEDYLSTIFDLLSTVKVVDVLTLRKFEGTANQIIITETDASTSSWLLKFKTPQNIDTAADVEFASILLNELTSGSVAFIDANKRISQDNAKFFWDAVNKRLGINTDSPTKELHVVGEAVISTNLGVGTVTPREALDVVGNGLISGNVGVGTASPATKAHIAGAITVRELSEDPSDPAEGEKVVWQSDGTDTGEDGDLLMKTTAGAVTTTINISQSLVPSGGIIMWSGAIVDIPAGWFLCDGSNSTPNLRDKFVLGAGTTAVGTTGANTKAAVEALTLLEANLPSHDHPISYDGSHTGHASGTGQLVAYGGDFTADSAIGVSSGSHNHGGSTGNAGGGTALNVSPPYYALAYIMKE